MISMKNKYSGMELNQLKQLKELSQEIVAKYEFSIVWICRVLDVHRSGYYYKKKRVDSEVIDAISKKAKHSNDGF